MTKAAIQISASYKIPESYRAELARADHVYGHTAPNPDALGGYFDFTDWRGRAVTKANFLGRWTLLYFGYARCEGTCRTAAPLIADAARELRDLGLPARAAFVDIDSPPLGMIQRIDTDGGKMTHGSNWSKRYAMGWMALRHGADLEVLSGGRFQLGQATAAYHVLREHVPARASESSLSINHSSTIFLIGPDTMVAGYGYHDMGTERIVELVQRLNEAERNPIDLTAIRERYIRGVCGA